MIKSTPADLNRNSAAIARRAIRLLRRARPPRFEVLSDDRRQITFHGLSDEQMEAAQLTNYAHFCYPTCGFALTHYGWFEDGCATLHYSIRSLVLLKEKEYIRIPRCLLR